MDWDKLRIFHAAAEAGSFTHAGESLHMSQSAVSRQVSALEHELKVPLFHRHARGLVLTEQGEMLFHTARDVFNKLSAAQTLLADTKARPSGELRVTTPIGLGSAWLTPRLGEFIELYPDISLELILSDEKLDISMRAADVGIWLREPLQNDLIRRPLFTVHLHAYASLDYLARFGTPAGVEDLDSHRILSYGGKLQTQLKEVNWLETAGRDGRTRRRTSLRLNNVFALKQAVRMGIGIAVLPDYLVSEDSKLTQVLRGAALPEFHTYFVYAEELKNSKRVNVFRDFLVKKSRQWEF